MPVNVLVAFEVLKAGHGWSDEQAYDAVCFDLQVRYALGLRDLYADEFCLRTVYNFRRAVTDHAARTGESLFETVFEQVTGEQQKAYEIASKQLRMDSTQVASNIRNLSRLQLLVEILQRMYRALDEPDRQRLEEEFAPYTRTTSGQYAYRLRADEPRVHLVRIGKLMRQLLKELEDKYGDTDAYGLLRRVFGEHFLVADELVLQRLDEDVSAQSLQSPDDAEATYRRKGKRRYRGYVANVTETCDESNDVQLIVDVAVQPNSADDGQMLSDAAQELAERTEVETLYTDGGYNGPQVDETLAHCGIEQVQTGIRGRRPERLGRAAFDWLVDEEQRPVAVICPGRQRANVERGRRGHTILARFDAEACSRCALENDCPTQPRRRRPERVLRCTARQVHAARRVRRSERQQATGVNPRAAVEATVWSVKAPWRHGRVPYRGLARVTMYTLASAAMVNVRRLAAVARHGTAGEPTEPVSSRPARPSAALELLLAAVRRILIAPANLAATFGAVAPERYSRSSRACVPVY